MRETAHNTPTEACSCICVRLWPTASPPSCDRLRRVGCLDYTVFPLARLRSRGLFMVRICNTRAARTRPKRWTSANVSAFPSAFLLATRQRRSTCALRLNMRRTMSPSCSPSWIYTHWRHPSIAVLERERLDIAVQAKCLRTYAAAYLSTPLVQFFVSGTWKERTQGSVP